MPALDLWNLASQLKTTDYRWVDLTHTLSCDTPHWFGFKPFESTKLFDYLPDTPGNMLAPMRCFQYSVASQYGTHVDAPRHFHVEGRSLGEIEPIEFMHPLCVIDKHEECAANPDFILTIEDLKAWEDEHGRIPEDAFVAFRSDWSKLADLENKDEDGQPHYPGWDLDAIKWLVEERNIGAIGHEPADTDPATITTREDAYPYPGEQYILSVDRYQIEVMDHLDELPATGAVIFCTFPKVRDGVGYPARVFAVCPAAYAPRVHSFKNRHPACTRCAGGIQSSRRPLRGRLLYGEIIHMQINKVTFIGKGGVGLLYGSMIAQALGNDAVEYVMDDARFERHANDVLTVNGKPCALKSIRASEATPADLVILTVKTTGLDQAIQTMEHIVGPNTLIASLCNGITSEQKIAERFGWKHTVLGICQGMDAVFLDGALTFTNAGEIRFGAAAGTEPATVTAIDELYTRCGIAHTVESDIAHRMWAKLMLNDGINQTCMAYGGTYGSATEPGSEQRRCFVSAMRETLAVANAEGIELTEADLTQMVHLIEGIDPAGMPSMAEDRVARRKTEVDEFAGTICRLAAKHDIQAPQNEWLYQRIRDIEKSW